MSEKTHSDTSEEQVERPLLEEGTAVPTSRVGRFLRTGWAARHAVPLAMKRTAELVSAKKEDRGEALEKLLKEQEDIAEELFRTLGNLKGVVQKFGQMASYLEGVLPEEIAPVYQKVLSRLQDSAPALPALAVRTVIEDELDCFLEDHFASFDEQPFAAASVGQVHRAMLYDGTQVAVKVQYPDIDKAFNSDLKNMKMIETLFAPIIHYYRGKETLDTLRQQLLDELDYTREAEVQERFRMFFEGHPYVSIPRVFNELSTSKVLVTEFIEGMTFEQICAADEPIRTKAAIALGHFYVESIHLHHWTNVDPHPGNYIFHEDGHITCLDFGAAVPIDLELMKLVDEHMNALIEHDIPRLQAAMRPLYGMPDDMDPVILEAHTALLQHYFAPLDPAQQPFRFSTEWISTCVEEGMESARRVLLRGGRVPKLPPPPTHVHTDLSVLYRVVLGLGSLLARLHVRHDWAELYRTTLEKRTQ